MKLVTLGPRKSGHTNSLLRGYDGVPDLPTTTFVFEEQGYVASLWRVSLWDRIRFVFDGRINLVAMGKTHPPISVSIGEYFSPKPKPGAES